MVTFNGDTLRITLDSGVTELNVQTDLYEPWKNWMLANPRNRRFPEAFRSTGGDPLTSIIDSGSYFFLQNDKGWRIKPPEEDINIFLVGNLAPESSSYPIFVPTDGAFTVLIAGLQPVTQGVTPSMAEQLEYASFQNHVSLDVINGSAGTAFPIGTKEYPSNNLTHAKQIAVDWGFTEIRIYGNPTLLATDNVNGYIITGKGQQDTIITITDGCWTVNTKFHDCSIVGTQKGETYYYNCEILALAGVHCYLDRCALVGNITMHATYADTTQLIDCYNGKSIIEPCIIDHNYGQVNMRFSSFRGHVKFINITNANTQFEIMLSAGTLTLDSSCTAGTLVVSGVGTLINNSSMTVDDSGLISTEKINQVRMAVESLHGEHQAYGKIWYVDKNHPDASDSNDGLSIDRPFLTIAKAYSKVSSDKNELIQITNVGNTTAVYDEQLIFSKNDMILRGDGQDIIIKPTATTGDTLTLSGKEIYISSIKVETADTGTTQNAIVISGDNCKLENVWVYNFIKTGVKVNGVKHLSLDFCDIEDGNKAIEIIDSNEVHIQHSNIWIQYYGIHLQGSSNDNEIDNCMIHDMNTGIYIDSGVTHTYIQRTNHFANMGTEVNNLGGSTNKYFQAIDNEGISNNIWNEPTSSHATPGTFGDKIGKQMLTIAKFLGLK